MFINLQLLKKHDIIIIVYRERENILFEVRRGNMKKSIILKSFFFFLVCAMLTFMTLPVKAATDEGFNDLLGGNTSSGTDTNSNSNTGNTNTNRNSSNVQNINALRNTTNKVNTSNNTNLPKTGLQDSLPTVLLVVVFGVSAVYAYKKIKDYRNID